MKVVQINCSASGSTGNIAKAIHRELLARGDESYIFYGIGQPTEKNMFRTGNYFDLHIHAVLSRNLGKQGYFSFFSTKNLIRQLKSIQPHIVHLHNLHGSYLNLPILFKYLRESQVKVLITLHDCWLFTGKCPHFILAGCEKWKEKCGGCTQLAGYPRSKVDTTKRCLSDKKKWLSGFGDRMRIVAVSNWLRDTARESFLKQYSIETIYNGINTQKFYPVLGTEIKKKYGIEDKFVVLGVASNWTMQKGLGTFIELSKQLFQDEMIVLIGVTKEQAQMLPTNMLGIERTENQYELAQWYTAADVFFNASKEETFGLVTAEAMACDTPAVVYNSTACSEMVNEDCVVLYNTSEKPVDAIREIKRKTEKVKMCREHIIENFSEEKMVRGYLDAYNWF